MRNAALSCIVALVLMVACKKTPADDESLTKPKPLAESATAATAPVPAIAKRAPKKPPEHPNPSPEALARKKRSETQLGKDGVKINATLPVVDAESEVKIRAKDAVVDRAIALMLVAVKGEGLEQEYVDRDTKRFGASAFFSPEERAFIGVARPSQADKAKFGWRYECLAVMLWALGFDAELGAPNKIVDAGRIVKLVMDKGPEKLRAEAKLRTATELLDANDLVYRQDWACVDARASGTAAPKALDCEIIVERHHASNWLIGYNGQEWDDVSTDT